MLSMEMEFSAAPEEFIYGAIDSLKDLSVPMGLMGERFAKESRRRFETGGDPKWTPLALSTIRRKGSSRPLIESGALKDSIAFTSDESGVSIFSDIPYSSIHQFGGIAGRAVPIPARPFLGVTQEDEKSMDDILHQFLTSL